MRYLLAIIITFSCQLSFAQTDSTEFEEEDPEAGYVSEEIKPVSTPPINLRYTTGQYLQRSSNRMIGGFFLTVGGGAIAVIGRSKGAAVIGSITSMFGIGINISGMYQLKLAGLSLINKD